jgi:hypothetical protein
MLVAPRQKAAVRAAMDGKALRYHYEGGEFDAAKFTIEKGAWDHEHCKVCGANIEPMSLCWVTKSGAYIILCADCHQQVTNT